MKRLLKKSLGLLALAVVTVAFWTSAMAAEPAGKANIGYINLDRIYGTYDRAQGLMADIKVKEAELRKMQADYVKQLEESRKNNPKSPVAVDQLEKDLNDKLTVKINEYRGWATTKQKELDDDITNTAKAVAQSQGIDVVLTQQAIFLGGDDLTQAVLTKLNATSTKQ